MRRKRLRADSEDATLGGVHMDKALRLSRHKQRRMARKGDHQTIGDLDGSQGRGIRIEIRI